MDIKQDATNKSITDQMSKTQEIFSAQSSSNREKTQLEGLNKEIERNMLFFGKNAEKDTQREYEHLIMRLTQIEKRLKTKK